MFDNLQKNYHKTSNQGNYLQIFTTTKLTDI